MKKLLLLFIISTFAMNAQVLLNENFSTLTVGNVGTDLSGVTSGQGEWLTRINVPSTGSNASFQIVDSGLAGNVLNITGFNGVAGTTLATNNSRFMSKSIATAWSNRDFGNEITEVEYDFNTGPATTSSNTMRVVLYDSSPFVVTPVPKMLAGFMITMNPLSIRALAWYDPTLEGGTGAIGNYSIPLGSNGATPPVLSQITLLPDTWYKVGFSYNYATGVLKFKDAGGLITRNTISGAAIGTSVDSIQIIGSTGGTVAIPNASAATGTFDNLIIRDVNSDSLLGVKYPEFLTNMFSISPNPANNLVTISSKDNAISNIEMTDLNGRVVKTFKVANVSETQINISDLLSGVYMTKITSENGVAIKKIIKN